VLSTDPDSKSRCDCDPAGLPQEGLRHTRTMYLDLHAKSTLEKEGTPLTRERQTAVMAWSQMADETRDRYRMKARMASGTILNRAD
jgi:hypothetical protein